MVLESRSHLVVRSDKRRLTDWLYCLVLLR